MDYNEMFKKAHELFNNKEFSDAGELYYEVAINTGDAGACRLAIITELMLAGADLSVAKSGLVDKEYSLDNVNKVISLLNFVNNNSIEIDEEKEEEWIKKASSIKGIILSILKDPECDKWLTWAEERGDNQSRFWHIYYLIDAIKTADDDEGLEILNRIKNLGEEYVENYNPDEAESDELVDICNLLSSLLEDDNPVKAEYYALIVNSFDKNTKTSKLLTKKDGLEDRCYDSSPEELLEIGDYYWYGNNGYEQSYEKAIRYYEMAADKGNLDAVYALGFSYANGLGVEKDSGKADELLSLAADHGHIRAARKLGTFLYFGDYLPKDKARGFSYLKLAADNGDDYALARVGMDYLSGIGSVEGWGPEKDFILGKEYLHKSCELNNQVGLYVAANYYVDGSFGFTKDLEYGMQLMKRAGEAGHLHAQYLYALACYRGDGVEKNDDEFIKWLKISADNGLEEAIVRLAWVRFTGMIDGTKCRSEVELSEVREIIDKAYENGDEFLHRVNNSQALQELYEEERRLGRHLTLNELYGSMDTD